MDRVTTEVVVMAEGLFRRPVPPEKVCDNFLTDHGLDDPPAHKSCFGIVCPHCDQTIPMAVETLTGLTQYLRCIYCRWAFMLDTEAFQQFVGGMAHE